MTEPTPPTMNTFERAGRRVRALKLAERLCRMLDDEHYNGLPNAMNTVHEIVTILEPLAASVLVEREAERVEPALCPPGLRSPPSEPT